MLTDSAFFGGELAAGTVLSYTSVRTPVVDGIGVRPPA